MSKSFAAGTVHKNRKEAVVDPGSSRGPAISPCPPPAPRLPELELALRAPRIPRVAVATE